MVIDGTLSEGHGRALLGASDAKTIEALADKASRAGLSVRETERLVRGKKQEQGKDGESKKSASVRDLEERLARKLGTRVEVQDSGGKGAIAIRYSSLDELDRLLDFILK
jgi:ParB family chromosome partitioning protein